MTTFLKKLRQKNNISQEFLANKLGISRPTYAQLENDERRMTVNEAIKAADFFGLTIEGFLSGKESPMPKVTLEKKSESQIFNSKKQEIRISVPQENIAKFKEVLLYILEKIGARSNIGEAVICKLLYFIDFDYYEKYEEQLIGATYMKNHYGPTPKEFPKIIQEMEGKDLVKIRDKYFEYPQTKYLPLRSPNLSILSANEIEVIDLVLRHLSDMNASHISEYSHNDVPWMTTGDGQIIDYESVFYRTKPYSVRD